jgi:hypothetical protein
MEYHDVIKYATKSELLLNSEAIWYDLLAFCIMLIKNW